MTFELAISTMFKTKDEVFAMLNEMNVKCNCIVINQCDTNNEEIEYIKDQRIHIVYTNERGLSKSRNMAIEKSDADIIAIADDDLYYYDSFDKIIIDYYAANELADIVIFNMDNYERSYANKDYRCNFFQLSSFTSMQITFKRKNIHNNFNVLFGTGSKIFDSGEENIFLANNYHSKNKIFYCSSKILRRDKKVSTWFKGYNDEKFIQDRGAIYYAMSRPLYLLYIIRFAFFKRKLLKPNSLIKSLRLMLFGKNKYKEMIKN